MLRVKGHPETALKYTIKSVAITFMLPQYIKVTVTQPFLKSNVGLHFGSVHGKEESLCAEINDTRVIPHVSLTTFLNT